MAVLCAQFGITRQAYYQQLQRDAQRHTEAALILELVRQVRRKHPRLGTRKLLVNLQPMLVLEGLRLGRDRLFTLLRAHDLLVRPLKTHRRTTHPGTRRTPNLLPGLTVVQPNQVWVCDLTYLTVAGGRFAYLFLLMDLYSRFIVGWQVATTLAGTGAVTSLQHALRHGPFQGREPIHHSDHGVQYTAAPYRALLAQAGFRPSMGQVGNCYDNSFAERVIGTLKQEYGLHFPFPDHELVRRAVPEAIHFYNTDRPHSALAMAVPEAVYQGQVRDIRPVVIPEVTS